MVEGRAFGVDDEFCGFWFFESRVFAGEVFHAACVGFCVESFDVAAFAFFEAGADVDFVEVGAADDFASGGAECAFWGDERDEGDDAGVGEEFGDFGDAADILLSVFVGEAEIFVETGANGIAVEHLDGVALLVELVLEGDGEGGFSRS